MAKTQPFENYSDIYEDWFVKNRYAYLSELKALQKIIPANATGFEIGVGSGLFAQPLNIKFGVEPSYKMRQKALKRGITVKEAVAEALPYPANSFDFALMVTTICFVDNLEKAFLEAKRVIKDNGFLILGFVDAESPLGKIYQKFKDKSLFYKEATFYSTKEVLDILKNTGFEVRKIYQTVFGKLEDIKHVQEPEEHFGKGSFVVIQAQNKV